MKKLLILIKGMGMGFADVIPGVSGGTIALITGIYHDFINGIKSVNFRWIAPLFAWVFSGLSRDRLPALMEPIKAIHWGFLVPLACGIVLAFGVGSVVVPDLMDRFPAEMAAFFVGLILASTIVPFRQMTERGPRQVIVALVAAALTFVAVGTQTHPALHWVEESHEEALSLEDFMRQYPSMHTAEHLYCPTGDANDNAALRDAIAADALQPGAAAHLDDLCSRLDAEAGDLAATSELRHDEHLGRKDEMNPFNNVLVPAGTVVLIPRPALWYVFFCGVIGICAMVLPGISGSFFLLVLGIYHFMLSSALKGFIYDLIDREIPTTQGLYVIVFSVGCLIGLLTFARVMSHLFDRYPSGTLAALMGMMLGSLRALWPWKIGDPHTGVANVMPPADEIIGPVVALAVGAAIVLAITWAGIKLGSDEHV